MAAWWKLKVYGGRTKCSSVVITLQYTQCYRLAMIAGGSGEGGCGSGIHIGTGHVIKELRFQYDVLVLKGNYGMGRQGRGIKKLVPNYASTLHFYFTLINNSNYINNNSRVCKTGVLIVN